MNVMGVNGNPAQLRAKLAIAVDDRRAKLAEGKVRGLSIRQIQAEMEETGCVNPTTGKAWSIGILDKDCQELSKRFRAEALEDITELRLRELEELAQVEAEAWKAWHRGIGTKKKTITERNESGKGAHAKASMVTEELNGDPRYLAIILDCRKQRRAILGLDAPERKEVSGPDGGPIQIDDTERAARIQALISGALDRDLDAAASALTESVTPAIKMEPDAE